MNDSLKKQVKSYTTAFKDKYFVRVYTSCSVYKP